MAPKTSPAGTEPANEYPRRQQVFTAQVRLLYGNANVGAGVTAAATAILGRLQWDVVAHPVIVAWAAYMLLVAAARFLLAQRYWRQAPTILDSAKWRDWFAVGAGLAGVGWAAGGILLYPPAHLENQIFLIFIVGGMMLGAASILAPRPEVYLPFIIPAGVGPAVRLMLDGDEPHIFMGLMAGVFTLAMVITTKRIHLAIVSSLNLQFENTALVEGLQRATERAEILNEQLELRVRERTAELDRSTEKLRAEIAQREQVEEQLLRARKLESLGVLAGGIAHDFNNFLAVVQGNIELAKLRAEPDAPVQEMLDETERACRRAAVLSSQLLTFSKGGAPVRKLASIAQIVKDAVALARAGADASFQVSIPEDLRFAEVDAGQIGQVLHNILLNARQAVAAGGAIEVSAENIDVEVDGAKQARVRISARDDGCGIPADVLPRIFDPYFTTKADGSGLGLATSYAIVAKHGGSLSAASEPGRGAVFTIELPASNRRPPSEAPAATKLRSGAGRVLVMDDEEAVRRLVKAVLSKLGYEVETAKEGAEAIALYESAKAGGRGFDAVVLDLTVSGGMGGVEAAARLKALDPRVKLIVSSGYSDAPVLSDLGRYGFAGVIPKPWTVAQVSEVMRTVLAADADRS